jgi:hypothetical protein
MGVGVRRSSLLAQTAFVFASLGLDCQRAESDVDRLRFLVASGAHHERVFPLDQTVAGEDNPLVCGGYSDADAFCDELRLL